MIVMIFTILDFKHVPIAAHDFLSALTSPGLPVRHSLRLPGGLVFLAGIRPARSTLETENLLPFFRLPRIREANSAPRSLITRRWKGRKVGAGTALRRRC